MFFFTILCTVFTVHSWHMFLIYVHVTGGDLLNDF